MKASLFRLTIRFCIKLLAFFVILGKWINIFGRAGGRILRRGLHYTLPVVLFFYLRARKLKARFFQFIAPIKGRLIYLFGHRYFIHALVVLIVAVAAFPSFRVADASVGNRSEEIPLRMLVPDEDEGESLIDDTLPAEELESYLEAFFQDQPPLKMEKIEEDLPLSLDDGALLRKELPGTRILPTRTDIVEYEVREGDTLWAIAEQFGLSVATVLWENKLTLYSTIRPGQKLAILPISGVSHIVRKGETLGAISKRYSTALDEVVELNQLADATAALTPGMKLVIPGGRPYSAPLPVLPRREVITPPSRVATLGGKLLWPIISKRITQYFTWRHAGLDIGDKTGAPIYAIEDGVVEAAGWGRGGWGNMVLVNHGNGMKTRYAHASKVLVKAGQQVTKGQTIASVGSTGRSTGPHLHLTIYVNGRPVNPLQYLR
ncbi:hypothetical protein A3B21_04875 [Candidatus Uhrbacteria bacterium RIFCSPLOWO2_01_FULL_47_24]|uniref:LysM domain-containing protein n=1 Tax=Candidatus Uhrbacteria bacterium RIFCSPLOWO2_01_FULL_47_24 TaxID=1802401 RepID=A0A1F7UUQ6_9BACT|nr:MAG: hypothetical protein A2753_00500 [Candidatus Uhrbacteria bacterium RIFCSPHIGHO2_01_FULL_47_11]OGL69286.1 MAG: hypothetical protein A3D58_03260 [Candidatus Uhrbacteria bacterium RIFCSPHIGHO2_02_FULL_46_47]OGL76359.1 MAG: hypothetical protein A3F52_00560 [Candidatus Uhrbacteria bacterium RIFCSPHIGHO2_12_FULL_47_11]OGL82022.1 MAG: hypothetical protein A3B21_04875 [Candidatus Uhrbacteria bacterium RIFCSPLOWO2_01_FULL_47_24]OGL85416.1 MAG: hypothetical protein A3J03_05040 [Candidatus Uhrbact